MIPPLCRSKRGDRFDFDFYVFRETRHLDAAAGGLGVTEHFGVYAVEGDEIVHVFDEDGVEKFKAYPKCIIETGVARKIENGAEEVAEIELEVSLMPDEFGNCVYEALAEELTDETVKTKWMTAFEPSMVQVKSA